MVSSVYEGKDYADEMFTEEQIAAAMNELPDYWKYQDIATLNANTSMDPEVVVQFAEFAARLGRGLSGNLTIRELAPENQRRRRAIESLKK